MAGIQTVGNAPNKEWVTHRTLWGWQGQDSVRAWLASWALSGPPSLLQEQEARSHVYLHFHVWVCVWWGCPPALGLGASGVVSWAGGSAEDGGGDLERFVDTEIRRPTGKKVTR